MATSYKYTGNNDSRDGTEAITGVGADGSDTLTLNGEAKVISDEQVAILSSRYQLVPEGSKTEKSAPSVESPDKSPDPTSASSSGAASAKGRQS